MAIGHFLVVIGVTWCNYQYDTKRFHTLLLKV
jgi:hypothetical protein